MEEPNNTIHLHDGRVLGYAQYGNAKGPALFYFHGYPGSRLGAKLLVSAAEQCGSRLLGIDRPGIGLSSFQPDRKILDWPDDVIEFADALNIDQFAVLGLSGGGPYALACAYKIPERITACGIVSGLGHPSHLVSIFSKWLPYLLLPILRKYSSDQQGAKILLKKVAMSWPEPDRKVLLLPGVLDAMADSLVESLRPGIKGSAYDAALLGNRNWGFPLQEIAFSKIYAWHGQLDKVISMKSMNVVIQKLPQCKVQLFPAEAHLSVLVNYGRQMLTSLMPV